MVEFGGSRVNMCSSWTFMTFFPTRGVLWGKTFTDDQCLWRANYRKNEMPFSLKNASWNLKLVEGDK